MEALRLITEAKNHQLIIDLPPSMDQGQLEVIIMPASSSDSAKLEVHKPSPLLVGTVTLMDDLIAPAAPGSDWDALR